LPAKLATSLRRHGFDAEMRCLATPPSLDPTDEDDGDRDGGACWSAVKFTEFGVARGDGTGLRRGQNITIDSPLDNPRGDPLGNLALSLAA
jgi:hypothetical protein